MQPTMSGSLDPGFEKRQILPAARFRKDNVSLVCAALGVVLNGLSYQSLEPHIVAAVFFILGMVVFRHTPLGGHAEWRMFKRVYCVGFLMAGVAAFYVEVWQDQVQLFSDPASFFRLARLGVVRGVSVANSVLFTDGSLMLYVWTPVYDFFEQWGMQRGRFVGVTVNVALVALNGVVGIKMARKLFGDDIYRFNRLIQLISVSGVFWAFAGLHVRDVGILSVMTLLSYACISFVQRPDFGRRLLILLLWFYVADSALVYLRNEFRMMPVVMVVAMVFALRGATQSRRLRRLATVFSVIGLAVILGVLAVIGEDMQKTLNNAHGAYEGSAELREGADESLGLSLIVKQPLPVRVVLGTAYTSLAPIPVFLGFLFPSAWHLFKSCNALFSYYLLPLLTIACWLIFKHKSLRTPAVLYVAVTAIVFSVAVGLSSMELRHLGAFYMMLLLLGTVPDLREREARAPFKQLLRLMLYGMGTIHLLWIVIKFV